MTADIVKLLDRISWASSGGSLYLAPIPQTLSVDPRGSLSARYDGTAMIVWSAALVVVGGVLSVTATIWLLVGLNPANRRYGTAGLRNEGLRNMLRDQRKMLLLLALGSALQLVGAVLALRAAIEASP